MEVVHVIEPRRAGVAQRLHEAWRQRALVRFFGARLLQRMYQRTWLGWIWIPLRPSLDLGAKAFIFGGLFGAPSQGAPYLLFLLVGMSAWELFDRTAFWGTRSLQLTRRFLRQMYVPRLTVIAGGVYPGGATSLVYLVFLVVAFAGYWIADGHLYLSVGPGLLTAPAGVALLVLLAYSIALWTSVYAVQARDVRFVLSYVLGLWFFITPIVLPLSSVPAGLYRTVVELNPATAPILLIKHGVFGTDLPPWTSAAATVIALALIGGGGLWFFARSEDQAADQF